MPPEELVTKDFLKEVFINKKQLLMKSQYKPITVPHYDELSVKNLWPEMKKDPEFCSYFPTKFPKDKGPSREYFFNILNTLQPEYLVKLMNHASNERMAADNLNNQA